MRSILSLLSFLIINITVFAQDINLPTSSAEKYNKRGFYKNEEISLNGNEVISDYDGNVMLNYSTPVKLPAELGGDFTITYNANVDHRVIDIYDDRKQGNMINAPEWILGYKGFALQTLNFETNFFVGHNDPQSYLVEYNGEELPLLIQGYHYGNSLWPSVESNTHDGIVILKADGSKLSLQNVVPYYETGLYRELGFQAKGFAVVRYYNNSEDPDCTNYRKVWYKPGDGYTYVFEEKKVNYYGNYDNVNCNPNAPKVFYLMEIYSPSSFISGYVLQFQYSSTVNQAEITYGRKVFTGIVLSPNSPHRSNPTELEVDYGYNGYDLLNISITNYNMNKRLSLNTKGIIGRGGSDGLFNTWRSTQNIRKLNVLSITDEIGRTDNFLYYGFGPDSSGSRNYHNIQNGSGKQVLYYYKFPLLKQAKYHSGNSSVFNYWDKTFGNPDPSLYMEYHTSNQYNYANMDSANRDCFTNFMIKSREISNRYNQVNALVKKENYTYRYDKDGRSIGGPGIKTIIDEYDGNTLFRKTVKNYNKIKTDSRDYNASDFEYSLKLMSECTLDISGSVPTGRSVEKYYTYDLGQLIDGHYDGTFDLRTTREIKRGTSSSEYSDITSTANNDYETCTISSGTSTLSRIIKKNETITDPNSLVKYTEYKNIFPTLDFNDYDPFWLTGYDNGAYFYSIGLPMEERVSKGGVIASDIVKEYEERGTFANKLKKVTANANTSRQSYTIYSYMDDIYYIGLPSQIENDRGVRQEFYYPNSNNFQEIIPGFIVKYDYSRIKSNFYHFGFQMQPFKTLTIFNNPSGVRDTLVNYSSYNPDGTLQFDVDPNGLHSAYAYDKAGRLISAALPASFIDGTTAFVPRSDYSMGTNFVYKEKKTNSGTTKSYSFIAPYYITSGKFERSGSSADIEYNSQMYHCFLSSAIGTSAQRGILRLRIQCTGNSTGYPSQIQIGGINTAYTGNNLYSTYSAVYVTVPETYGNYIDLDVDISPLLKALGSTGALCGFRISPSLTANDMGINTSITFAIEKSPVCTAFFSANGAAAGDPIDKQPNITGTVVYNYDDVNNIVTQKRRLNSDPNPANFKEVTAKEDLDAFGQVRASSTLNDLNAFELKGTNTYNSDGKVLVHTDGEGRTVANSYDFLQRTIRQTNGDNTYKTTEYYFNPGTIANEWNSAVYSEYSLSIDEQRNAGRGVYTYYDKVGNKVAEKVGTNPPTIFQYDNFYRLYRVISPELRERTYSYDELGNLKQKDAPDDEGTTYYKYDKYKRLRFTMHADAANNEPRGITFTKYDQLGRVLATGTLPSTFGWESLDADRDYSVNQNLSHFENYQSDTSNFVCVNMYDKYTKSGIFATMPDPFWWSQDDANSSRNLKGKLVLTAFRDKPGQGWNYRLYLYDYLGNVNHIFQKFSTTPWKLIAKGTNVMGNLTFENVYKVEGGSLVFEHATWRNYDKQGRLIELRSDPSGNYSTSRQEATYTYNKADQCSTLTYSQVTNENKTTTYTYHAKRGWLTKVANGSSNFSEVLGFYADGTIRTQAVTNSVLGGAQNLSYYYDTMNRLTSVLQSGATRESFQYDLDGNVASRDYLSEGVLKNFSFAPSGNRISSIFTDRDEFGYYYDYKGNVTDDQYGGVSNITYDHRNLPLSMTTSSFTSRYRYDDGGNRIFKDAQGGKEYYFRDDLGHEFAVYDVSTDRLKMINLFGGDLLGRIDFSWRSEYDYEMEEYIWSRTDSRKFYVKDHLGSIRQTINESGTVMSAMDYYAFGGTMSSYISGSTVDKYKFTGKERDLETGLDYFGARYYDSKYGRWMSVDPLADKFPGWSPYNYCFNNPLRLSDPDGRGPGDLFKTKQDAAHDWGMTQNRISIRNNVEYSSLFYRVTKNGTDYYSYTDPRNDGKPHEVKLKGAIPKGASLDGYIHSHGAYTPPYGDNVFSEDDKKIADNMKSTAYLASPNGSLLEYNPTTGNVNTLATDLNSDINDPTRKNDNIAIGRPTPAQGSDSGTGVAASEVKRARAAN